MSIDSIVNVTITSQSLHMSQAGFGTPLIIAEHDYWTERVKSFSDLSELTFVPKKPAETAPTNVARTVMTTDSGAPAVPKKEPQPQLIPKDSALYLTAQALISQTPRVPKFKVGLREKTESVADALDKILLDDKDGDFYGILLAADYGDDHAKYIADVQSLISTLKDKRLLAGIDVTEKQLAAFPEKGMTSGRLFYIYKEDGADFPAAAWMGKMLPEAPGSTTWAFKELRDITKSKLNTTTIDTLKKRNINRHLYINNKGVTLDGKVSADEYIDIVHGIDWLHVRIQERIFRLLMLNGKIPYTLKGIDLVRSELLAQLKDAVRRGLLAEDPEPTVSIPDIDSIPIEKKESRILPDVKFSARLAGAIHAIEIRGTVTN